MAGFENDVLVATNVNFNPTSPKPHNGIITADGQLLIGAAVAPYLRAGTISAGPGATVTNGAGSITIGLAGPMGYSWSVITSAGNVNAMLAFNGYITGGVALTTLLLPAAAAIGDMFIVTGLSSLFQIQQNAGQSIILGNQTSTVGVGGSISSTQVSDSVVLVCVTANTTFKVLSSMGNLTVV